MSTLGRCRQRNQEPSSCRMRLPSRRVVGHDLLSKIGTLCNQRLHRGQQSLGPSGVDGVDRPCASGHHARGQCRYGSIPDSDAGEGHDEPIPPTIKGQVAQRPSVSGWHRGVVQRIRNDPLRGALEDRQSLDVRRNGGPIWKPLAPAPMSANLVPTDVEVLGPACGVERWAREAVHPVDLGQLRAGSATRPR